MMFRHSIFQMKVTLSGDSREDDHGIEEKNSDNGATDIRLSEDKAQHTMAEKDDNVEYLAEINGELYGEQDGMKREQV